MLVIFLSFSPRCKTWKFWVENELLTTWKLERLVFAHAVRNFLQVFLRRGLLCRNFVSCLIYNYKAFMLNIVSWIIIALTKTYKKGWELVLRQFSRLVWVCCRFWGNLFIYNYFVCLFVCMFVSFVFWLKL